MDKQSRCPVCNGNLEIKDSTLDQSDKPLKADLSICVGGKESAYGCGFKSWRRKKDL